MNIKLLKEVIRHLKRHVHCPTCQQEYGNANINIIGALPDQAVFHLQCRRCQGNIFLSTVVQNNRKQRKIEHHPHEESSENSKISKDEVLDMHNFLKKFDGNFRQQFKT